MRRVSTKTTAVLILAGLCALDTILTIRGIRTHGLDYEANPLMRMLVERHGLFAFASIKVGVVVPFILFRQHVKDYQYALLILLYSIVAFLGVMAQ